MPPKPIFYLPVFKCYEPCNKSLPASLEMVEGRFCKFGSSMFLFTPNHHNNLRCKKLSLSLGFFWLHFKLPFQLPINLAQHHINKKVTEMQAGNAEDPKKPLKNAKKSHICKQCCYGCNRPSKLKKHMLVHSGEKPFVCTQCNFSYTRADNLRVHMRTHTGEKPFHCKQCDYSCTTSSHLKEHMLTHSGEKLFHCNQCTSSFTQRDYLKRHMSTHSGEKRFSCDQCNYSCNQTSNLKTHIRQHTGEKPFACN